MASVYVARERESFRHKELLLKELDVEGKRLLCLVGTEAEDSCGLRLREFALSLCRSCHLLRNDRSLLLKTEDALVAMQLCIAQRNRQKTGEYVAQLSEVLDLYKAVVEVKAKGIAPMGEEQKQVCEDYSEFLRRNNVIDEWDMLTMLKQEQMDQNSKLKPVLNGSVFVLFGCPRKPTERELLEVLFQHCDVYEVCVATPLNSSLLHECAEGEVLLSLSEWGEIFSKEEESSQGTRRTSSVSGVFSEKLFVAYLRLLVNSRDELALAVAVSGPGWELDHEAFTAIKREAKGKNMPMFQSVLSYVLKNRLGGKGYAPDSDCPLLPYTTPLGEFVDLIQKLQAVIEEVNDSCTAAKKIISIVKRQLLSAKETLVKRESVEQTAEGFASMAEDVSSSLKTESSGSPNRDVSSGRTIFGHFTKKVLRGIVDRVACKASTLSILDAMGEATASQGTPVRLQSLMALFRSPDVAAEADGVDMKPLKERIMADSMETPKLRYKSCMSWAPETRMFKKEESPVAAVSYHNPPRSPVRDKENLIILKPHFSATSGLQYPDETHNGFNFSNGLYSLLSEDFIRDNSSFTPEANVEEEEDEEKYEVKEPDKHNFGYFFTTLPESKTTTSEQPCDHYGQCGVTCTCPSGYVCKTRNCEPYPPFILAAEIAVGCALVIAIAALTAIGWKMCLRRRICGFNSRPREPSLSSVDRYVVERLQDRPPSYYEAGNFPEKPPSYDQIAGASGATELDNPGFSPDDASPPPAYSMVMEEAENCPPQSPYSESNSNQSIEFTNPCFEPTSIDGFIEVLLRNARGADGACQFEDCYNLESRNNSADWVQFSDDTGDDVRLAEVTDQGLPSFFSISGSLNPEDNSSLSNSS